MALQNRLVRPLRHNSQHWAGQGLLVTLTGLITFSVAAASLTSVPLAVTQIYASNRCGSHPQAAISVISQQQQLRKITSGVQRLTIGQDAEVMVIDFKKYRVLHIDMGQKRTAGHSISLARPDAQLIDGRLVISVNWHEPAKGQLLAQVLTHPCMLLQVPLVKFNSIQVIDQTGKQRIKYLQQ